MGYCAIASQINGITTNLTSSLISTKIIPLGDGFVIGNINSKHIDIMTENADKKVFKKLEQEVIDVLAI